MNILEKHGFRGCISVRRNRQPQLCLANGYADYGHRVKNTAETRFATASAGKAFVAVGILQLIERGKLSFSDTIARIPVDWKQIDTGITVRELLTHTSGIPDYFDESVMTEYDELWRDFPNYKIRKSADLLPLFIDKPMMYPRGTRFQYNNTGFVVLGLMIEAVTGKPFDVYLRENVFEPAGMAHTGYYELDRLPENCANHYIFDAARGDYYTNIFSVDAKGTGAGGAFTTVPDVERFWDALLGYRLLSGQMTEEMLSVQVENEGEDSYGLGIWMQKKPDGYVPYFTGSDPGVSFISLYNRKTHENRTLVSNYGDNVWVLAEQLEEIP